MGRWIGILIWRRGILYSIDENERTNFLTIIRYLDTTRVDRYCVSCPSCEMFDLFLYTYISTYLISDISSIAV